MKQPGIKVNVNCLKLSNVEDFEQTSKKIAMKSLILLLGFLTTWNFGFSQGFVTADPDSVYVPCPSCSGAQWSNGNPPSAITGYPFSIATIIGAPDLLTKEIQFRDYDMGIPANAIVTGCEVIITHNFGGGTAIMDSIVKLTINGIPMGSNKAFFSNWIPFTDTVTYGSSTDTWGLNLTPSMVNNNQLGISFKAFGPSIVTAMLTNVQLRIYYDIPCDYSFTFAESSPGQFNFENSPNVSAPGSIIWTISYGGSGGSQFSNNNDPSFTVTQPSQVCMLVYDPSCPNGPSFQVCDSVIPNNNSACSVDLGPDIDAISNCTAQTLSGTTSGTSGAITYSWTSSPAVTLFSPSNSSTYMTSSTQGPQFINLTIVDANGCSASDQLLVNFISPTTTFVENTCGFPIQLCKLNIPTSGPLNWTWVDSTGNNHSATGNCISVNEPGSYQLFTVYQNNCTVIHNYMVTDTCANTCNGNVSNSGFLLPDSAKNVSIPGSFNFYTNSNAALFHNGNSFNPTPVWVSTGGTKFSEAIVFHDFDFSIPANAQITGIEFFHNHGGMNSNTYVIDSVFLFNGTNTIGQAKRDSTSSGSIDTLGGPGDMWNTNLTATEINNSDFGFYLFSTMVGMGGTYGQFDFRAKIHYCLPDSTTSINENNQSKGVSIFPNPSSSYINIEFESANSATIKIYDLTGKLVILKQNYLSGMYLDINSLPSGIYIINISNSDTFLTERMIKQ